MEVKEAVRSAKRWLEDVLEDEQPTDVGLEEVDYEPEEKVWRITLGFSRPFIVQKNAMKMLGIEPPTRRAYRIISVHEPDGKVLRMTKPRFED